MREEILPGLSVPLKKQNIKALRYNSVEYVLGFGKMPKVFHAFGRNGYWGAGPWIFPPSLMKKYGKTIRGTVGEILAAVEGRVAVVQDLEKAEMAVVYY